MPRQLLKLNSNQFNESSSIGNKRKQIMDCGIGVDGPDCGLEK